MGLRNAAFPLPYKSPIEWISDTLGLNEEYKRKKMNEPAH